MKKRLLALAVLSSLSAFADEMPRRQQQQQTSGQSTIQIERPTGSLVEEILSTPTLQTRDLTSQRRVDGGTGIGGAVVFEGLIAWCDQAAGVLHDARVEARELWGASGAIDDALAIYRQGLEAAASTAPEMPTTGQAYTLRYIERGLVLAQILGVDDILSGRQLVNRQSGALLTFFDWYLGFTRDVGQRIDRPLYVPYISGRHTQIEDLENRIVNVSIRALSDLDAQFVRTMPDGSNHYTTIPVPTYLKSVSYLARQVANDLRESLYAEAFVCQAGRLDQLAAQIDSFISSRRNSSLDPRRLNRFTLALRDILNKLNGNGC